MKQQLKTLAERQQEMKQRLRNPYRVAIFTVYHRVCPKCRKRVAIKAGHFANHGHCPISGREY